MSYQGGKQRLAKKIVDIINPSFDKPFFDLCCGSGSISIELINRGFPSDKIYMLDAGPWGRVWDAVGKGWFDINYFKRACCDGIPKDRKLIQEYIKKVSKGYVYPQDVPYDFLLLQAASFGSKAIWIENNKWRNCSFRNYWEPTATSNRRSPVNPMMPMPETLFARMEIICEKMLGVHGYWCDIFDLPFKPEGTIYIDPPYADLTAYGHTFDVIKYIKTCKNIDVYVSEGKPLNEHYHTFTSEAKGGISGVRSEAHKEYLSHFKANEIC